MLELFAELARGDRVAGTVRKMDAMNDLKGKYDDLLWLAHLDVTDREREIPGVWRLRLNAGGDSKPAWSVNTLPPREPPH